MYYIHSDLGSREQREPDLSRPHVPQLRLRRSQEPGHEVQGQAHQVQQQNCKDVVVVAIYPMVLILDGNLENDTHT